MSKRTKTRKSLNVLIVGFFFSVITFSGSTYAAQGYYQLPGNVFKALVTPTNDYDPPSGISTDSEYSGYSDLKQVYEDGRIKCIIKGSEISIHTKLAFDKCQEVDIDSVGKVTIIASSNLEYFSVFRTRLQDGFFDFRVEDWNETLQEKVIFYIPHTNEPPAISSLHVTYYSNEVSAAQSFQYPNPGLAPVPQDPPVPQDFCARSCGTNIQCLAVCYQMISNILRADSDSTLNTGGNPSPTRKTFQYPDPSLAPTPDPCSDCGGNIECRRVCLLNNNRY